MMTRNTPAILLVLAALAYAAPASALTERAEYDLVLNIRAEASPQKRIKLLDEWKLKYPKSDLRQVRRELYLAAYHSLGDGSKMLAAAQEMLGEEPDNFVGLYWCTLLTPTAKDSSPDALKAGEEAARRLVAGLDGFLASGKKPSAVSDQQWAQERADLPLMGHRTLGWTYWQRGNFTAAEMEFAECLKLKPMNAEISAWMGMVLALQRQPDKIVAAFWHLARAGSLRDEGALPEGQRRQVMSLLERSYTSYHGDSQGLEKLQIDAVSSVLPPSGFSVESAAAIAERRAEIELERTNPELAAWNKLRKRLEAPDGEEFFGLSVQNVAIPKLKGTLVRATPAKKPTELALSVAGNGVEEVILKLSAPLAGEADAGTALMFEGVAQSFTRSPFSLVLAADSEKIQGWPPPPASSRKK